MGRVFVVGSFNVDHVWRCDALPSPGQTLAGSYGSGPGGKGFNQAMAARRAGAGAVFVCALGSDAGGQLARALANADDIDLRALTSKEPTGTAGIYVDARGRNCIVIGAGANAALSADAARAHLHDLDGGDVLLVQAETPIATVQAVLAQARERGALAILNPAPANAEVDAATLALCDIATPNETEFCALLARAGIQPPSADAVAGLDDVLLHGLCRRLLPQASVVLTLGAAGCFVSHAPSLQREDAQASYRVPAPAARVVDTTGAGDAFNGALAASLALGAGRAFAAHVVSANHYAARSTESAGAALAMPRLQVAY